MPNSSHAERTVVFSGSFIDDVPRLAVGHPVGKRGDDVDPVVALRLAVADVILESRRRTDGALAVVVVPLEAVGAGRIPGVADHEERRAVGLLQRVLIGGGAQEAAAQRVLLLLLLGPGDRR